MAEALIEDVSDTAFMVAAERAREGDRPDALFRDPLSGILAGERGQRIVERLGKDAAVGTWAMALRTVIIDEFVRAALAEGVSLVVNLGAGLDTRPYRLELPATLGWVEVDFPKVIDLKQARLANERPHCQLERLSLDLSNRAARGQLFAELNRRSKDVLVLTEGVVPYLSVDEAGSLADDLRAQDHFRRWIVDYISPKLRELRKRRVGARFENAPHLFTPDDWFGFFEGHGWPVKQMRYLGDEGRRRNRPPPLSAWLQAAMALRGLFMSAEGRKGLRQFMGYALLER